MHKTQSQMQDTTVPGAEEKIISIFQNNTTKVSLGSDGDYESDFAILDEDFPAIAKEITTIFTPPPQEGKEESVPDDFKKVTGWDTPAERSAYELGREHEEKVIIDFIKNWDGSTNSVMGELLKSKCSSTGSEATAPIGEQEIGFGDYVQIEMKRYGVPNEFYTYKVIGRLRTNQWMDVPAITHHGENVHDTIEDVINCVCESVGENRFERYRVRDVKLIKRPAAPAIPAVEVERPIGSYSVNAIISMYKEQEEAERMAYAHLIPKYFTSIPTDELEIKYFNDMVDIFITGFTSKNTQQ